MTRLYHPWAKWECYKAGFFDPPKGKGKKEADRKNYARLLTDMPYFETTLQKVLAEWPNSCEHNLTNDTLNRVAWLGQASATYEFGCCAETTRSIFVTLTVEEQKAANQMALKYLNKWLERRQDNERPEVVQCR